jgi:hypothetical protein
MGSKRQMFDRIDRNLEKLPPIYTHEDTRGDLPAVYLFTPSAGATWVIWEYDADAREGFGYCDLGFGMGELGYVSIDEIKAVPLPLGLWIETDTSVTTRFDGYDRAGATVPDFLKEKV